jgi:hypothetical protein
LMRHHGHIKSDRDEVYRIKRKASKRIRDIPLSDCSAQVEAGHMLGKFLL